ncbi:MAG: MerR family transcriptional regulator, partial [Acidimicrobiia bacterium]|nr:MerR family transcriptional regulator [Acidimicrobiia bacterium]
GKIDMENSDYINDADEIGLYVMSVAAKLVGTHPQTLREYERRGLITPQRTDGGNRRYANNDIERLMRIKTLREEGMSLTAITQLLEYEKALYNLKQENLELKNALEDTQFRLDDVENRLAQVEDSIDSASMEIVKIGMREIVLAKLQEENNE